VSRLVQIEPSAKRSPKMQEKAVLRRETSLHTLFFSTVAGQPDPNTDPSTFPHYRSRVSTDINIAMDPKPFPRRFPRDNQVANLYYLQSCDID